MTNTRTLFFANSLAPAAKECALKRSSGSGNLSRILRNAAVVTLLTQMVTHKVIAAQDHQAMLITAIRAIGRHNLCAGTCKVIVVDTVVKRVAQLRSSLPSGEGVFALFETSLLRKTRLKGTLLIPGKVGAEIPSLDTAAIAVHVIQSADNCVNQCTVGIVSRPPRKAYRTWVIRLRRVRARWEVLSAKIWYEP